MAQAGLFIWQINRLKWVTGSGSFRGYCPFLAVRQKKAAAAGFMTPLPGIQGRKPPVYGTKIAHINRPNSLGIGFLILTPMPECSASILYLCLVDKRGFTIMRQIVALVFLSFVVAFNANADNEDVQQGIFDAYLKLASGGDAVAQYVVAQRYENGKGTAKNLEKALYWYEMAAKQNYPLAVVKLDGYKKEQTAAAEPALTEKVQNTTPQPKETPLKREPEKKPSASPKETVAKPKVKPDIAPVVPVKAPPVQASKPKPAEPVAHKEEIKPAPPKETVAKAKVKPDIAPVVPVKAPPVQASKPKPAEPVARHEEVKQEARLPAPEVVAKAPVVVEPPLPNINVIPALLAGKWKRNQQDADFLPSANAACLQSSNAEVVCFSTELTRNLDNNGMTYNVKSVISGINNKEAKFNLRYTYNVVHIAGKPHEQTNGMRNEVNDMTVKTGWQEPGVGMECRMRDERSLICTRADRRMTYQFVRD